MTNKISVYILQYPGSMLSAVYGAFEFIDIANSILKRNKANLDLYPKIIKTESSLPRRSKNREIIFIPPATNGEYYLNPNKKTLAWINNKFSQENIISSACAGLFILAASDIITDQVVTTHWGLEDLFKRKYPHIKVNVDKIIQDEGSLITSGGMMSWQDLILHTLSKLVSRKVMNELGRHLIIDIPKREQKNYIVFTPTKDHKNKKILEVQEYIEKNLSSEIKVSRLAQLVSLGERTFLRQFKLATGLTPLDYIQRSRIKSAQKLLEETDYSSEEVAFTVGYNDYSAFRKVFIKKTGLSPSQFKKQWSTS